MSEPDVLICLGNSPTILFMKWLIQLLEYIASTCNQHYGSQGLLAINFHLTDAEYAALPHVLDAAGVAIVPNVRPAFNIQPLAGSAAQLANIKQENAKSIDVNAGMAKVRAFAIRSAGSAITDEISDPATGLTGVSFHQLVQHVKDTYGVLTVADVTSLRESLLHWDTAKNVRTNLLAFQQTHLVLSNAGYAVNEDLKISNLAQATRSNMAIQDVFKLYRTEQPVIRLQTYAALRTKIELLEQTFTAAHAGYNSASAADRMVTTAQMQAHTDAAVKLAVEQQAIVFQKQFDSFRSNIQASPRRDYDDPARKLVKEYCDSHGNLCYQCYGGDKTEVKFIDCKQHNKRKPKGGKK